MGEREGRKGEGIIGPVGPFDERPFVDIGHVLDFGAADAAQVVNVDATSRMVLAAARARVEQRQCPPRAHASRGKGRYAPWTPEGASSRSRAAASHDAA